MATIHELATAVLVNATAPVVDLPHAAWDLLSFLGNAKTWVQTAGGALLALLGAVALVWGGVLLVKKLMANPQTSQQTSWVTIGLLIIVGGALLTGGWTLIATVGSGGQQTIEDLGGGTVVVLPADAPGSAG